MAVDPDLVDDIAAGVADIYREAEQALADLVSRHLRAGLDSPTAERRLGGIRALHRSAQSIVAALEADTGPVVRDALAESYRHGWRSALSTLPERWFQRSGIGQAARAALGGIPGFGFVEALAQALTRDLGAVHRNILRNVDDAYRSVQAAAAARIVTGAETRRQAAQAAWQRWVDRGLTSFTDRSGRRWRLSSYAEMATRTNAQRAATQAQVDRLDTIGIGLVYVSDAVQECRLCRPFEGRVLRTGAGPTGALQVEHGIRDGVMVTVDVVDTLDGARARGLHHPNCRHSISAYLPGVTRLPEQPTADPAGDEARQRQRALERRIRQHKERERTALTDAARTLARKRVRAAQAELRDHLAAHPDLKRLPYREQIGAGNIPPGRNGPAAGDLGGPSEPTLDGGPALAPPRRTSRTAPEPEPEPADDRTPAPDQPELEAPPEQLPRRTDPADMTDDELEAALMAAMDGDTVDQAAFDRISAEIDRRDAERTAEADRIAEEQAKARDREWSRAVAQQRRERREQELADRMLALLDQGWDEQDAVEEVYGISVEKQRRQRAIDDLREQGHTGRGFDELARKAYADHVYQQWLVAEDATRGHMVTREGQARGIDPRALFTGPEARARKWASDELKAWWDEHGRTTFDEFRAMLLDDPTALRRQRDRRGGDFLS